MPISPELMALYPGGSIHSREWKAIVKAIRVRRAGNRCEACGVRHLAWGWRDRKGTFHRVSKADMRRRYSARPPFLCELPDGRIVKIIQIVITIAHKNHDVTDNRDENLAAWCQRDHNAWDRPKRLANARRTFRRRFALRDLFEAEEVRP